MKMPECLEQAIYDGNVEAVRRLVASQPEWLESTTDFGSTPLMYAAFTENRDVAVIKELLAAGAAVNRQTREGYTALHCAIGVDGDTDFNRRDVITLLIEAGSDLTIRQHYGWTPLLRAVAEGTPIEVETLLAAGSDPNAILPHDTLPAFNAGRNALMAALVSCYSEAIINALLRAGADPLARDAHGATFFDYVAETLEEFSEGEFADSVRRCLDIARRYDEGKSCQT